MLGSRRMILMVLPTRWSRTLRTRSGEMADSEESLDTQALGCTITYQHTVFYCLKQATDVDDDTNVDNSAQAQ